MLLALKGVLRCDPSRMQDYELSIVYQARETYCSSTEQYCVLVLLVRCGHSDEEGRGKLWKELAKSHVL